jgi:hypothetical protein
VHIRRHCKTFSAFWKKAGSAVIMGTAIYGMHYTGMAAANFAPGSVSAADQQDVDCGGAQRQLWRKGDDGTWGTTLWCLSVCFDLGVYGDRTRRPL